MGDEPGKAGTVGGDDVVAVVDSPNEGAMLEEMDQPPMPADLIEREEDRATTGKMFAIGSDDLHGSSRLDLEQRGHGRSMDYLPGTDAETAFLVAEDEPGCPFTTEFTVAIVEERVSLIWLHELMLPQV